MKLFFIISFLASSVLLNAQSKKERKVLANARLLENTVFGTKDSAILEKLFGSTLSYGHSSGKIENRQQAIHSISTNKSIYKKEGFAHYLINERGDSLVVEHAYVATETKADGSQSKLDLTIETVWAKEGKEWKLFRRQARKNVYQ